MMNCYGVNQLIVISYIRLHSRPIHRRIINDLYIYKRNGHFIFYGIQYKANNETNSTGYRFCHFCGQVATALQQRSLAVDKNSPI